MHEWYVIYLVGRLLTYETDDEILLRLVKAVVGDSVEERKNYRQGLSRFIGELRSQNMASLEQVAPAIVEYRRHSLKDKSHSIVIDTFSTIPSKTKQIK